MRKRSWTSGVLATYQYLIEAWWNCGKLPGHVWIAVSDMQLEISHSIWDIWATKMMKKYGKIVSKHPQAMSLNTISQVRLANATRSHNQSCRSQQHLLLKQMCLYVSVVFRWFQLLQHEWIFDVRDSMNSIYNYIYISYLSRLSSCPDSAEAHSAQQKNTSEQSDDSPSQTFADESVDPVCPHQKQPNQHRIAVAVHGQIAI